MRIYLNGTLSNYQSTFLIEDIFLIPKDSDVDNDDIASYDCIKLSGLEIDSSINSETNEFSCRWKGVELSNEKEYGEDFTKEDLLNIIRERNLIVGKAAAYYDTDVNCKIDSFMVLDGDWGTETYLEKEFGEDFIKEEIEFISDEPEEKIICKVVK